MNKDEEILRSVAIAKENFTKELFVNAKHLYCPVCGDICPVFQDLIGDSTLIFCRGCHSMFSCRHSSAHLGANGIITKTREVEE